MDSIMAYGLFFSNILGLCMSNTFFIFVWTLCATMRTVPLEGYYYGDHWVKLSLFALFALFLQELGAIKSFTARQFSTIKIVVLGIENFFYGGYLLLELVLLTTVLMVFEIIEFLVKSLGAPVRVSYTRSYSTASDLKALLN